MAERKSPGFAARGGEKQVNRRKKRTTKARSNQSPPLPPDNSTLRDFWEPATTARPPAPTLSNPRRAASQPPDLQQTIYQLLYGSGEERIQVAIRMQPKLVMNRREYDLAKDLVLAGNIERLRKIFRELARDLAKDSVRYWLDYLGVKPSKGGAPRKELFTDSKAYPVGHEVEEAIERFKPLSALKSQLSPADLRKLPAEREISAEDVDFILSSRNPSAAACKSVSFRSGLSLKTVRNYYLQYQRKRPKN